MQTLRNTFNNLPWNEEVVFDENSYTSMRSSWYPLEGLENRVKFTIIDSANLWYRLNVKEQTFWSLSCLFHWKSLKRDLISDPKFKYSSIWMHWLETIKLSTKNPQNIPPNLTIILLKSSTKISFLRTNFFSATMPKKSEQ